ncbi:MAG: bifunctional oligoribonuclease/PAP phosphatase NrnA [Planctomycetota bacterium]
MGTGTVPADVVAAVQDARRIVVASHVPMDGDGLGAGLALVRGLGPAREGCTLVTESWLPRACTFLEGYGDVVDLRERRLPACDLIVALDAGSAERLGGVPARRPGGARILNIDHHVSNTSYGDWNWIDPEAAATGELCFLLLRALDAPIDAAAAQALLVSLMTDTGRFCYSSTRPRTLEIAADLLRLGADPDRLSRHVYRSVPRNVLALRTKALERIGYHVDGALAVLAIPHDFGSDLGAEEEDLRELVDLPIAVAGVLVAALFRGLPDGAAKVSLRSKNDAADVAAFATARGGGGHVRAAGYPAAGGAEAALRAALPGLAALAAAAVAAER